MQFLFRHVTLAAVFFFVAINSATAQETDKNKFPLGWTVSGKSIPPQCFATEWMSSDNYKAYASFGSDFFENPGKYFGKEIKTLSPIEGINIVSELDRCFEGSIWDSRDPDVEVEKNGVETTIKDGLIESKSCDATGSCTDYVYWVIDSVSTETCQELAPNLSGSCISSYLIGVGGDSGGSIGRSYEYNIYGLFETDGNKKFIVPLKNFDKENDALNYLDSIKSKGKISECVVSLNEDGENISITLRGFLAPKTAHHPVQGKFTRTVLVLEQATCFEHLESWEQMFPDCPQDCVVSYISQVQIDDFEQLPAYGRPVTVTGKTVISHTGWHLTPIMIYVESIKLQE